MAQYQIPGGPFVVGTDTRQVQVPGGPFWLDATSVENIAPRVGWTPRQSFMLGTSQPGPKPSVAPLILRDWKRHAQPQGAVEVDWANPLSLHLYTSFNAREYNPQEWSKFTPTSISNTTNSGGYALRSSSGSIRGRTYNVTNNFTCLITFEQPPSGGNYRVAASCGNLWMGKSNGDDIRISNSGIDSILGSLSPGKLSVLIASRRDSNHIGCLDGKISQSTNVPTGSSVITLLNHSGGGFAFADGSLNLSLFWSRSLSDAELIEVSKNPWQLFKPVQQRIYVGV